MRWGDREIRCGLIDADTPSEGNCTQNVACARNVQNLVLIRFSRSQYI